MSHRHTLLPVSVALAMMAAFSVAGAADGRKAAATAASRPASSRPVTGGEFESFSLILERNIFNPNRVGRTRATVEDKPARVDEISLVGVVQYRQEKVAIFDSPDAALRKECREGDALSDFKIERIAADGVDLSREGKTVALKVAQQLRKAEGGDWKVGTNQAARVDSKALAANGSAAAGAARPAAPGPVEIPADASDVLKRLMKKRETQLKK